MSAPRAPGVLRCLPQRAVGYDEHGSRSLGGEGADLQTRLLLAVVCTSGSFCGRPGGGGCTGPTGAPLRHPHCTAGAVGTHSREAPPK